MQFGPLLARGAEPKDVEPVAVRLEPLLGGELVDDLGDVALEAGRRRDVNNFAATSAEEVVMVFGEVLGKLKAGKLVVGGDAPDHPRDLQVNEVAVRGTAGHCGEAPRDVPDTDRVTGSHEQVDDRPSASSVALVDPPEPFGDLVVEAVSVPVLGGNPILC